MKTNRNPLQGSAILGLLILVLILSSITGSYLRVALDEFELAQRTMRLQAAMNVAEAAAENAIYSILKDDWDDWEEVDSDHFFNSFSLLQVFNNRSSGKVYVNFSDPDNPILLCEGTVTSRDSKITKQIRLDLAKRALFANGLTAKNTVTMNGNNINVDSYHSSKNGGVYDPLFNRNDRGTVGSVSVAVSAVAIQNADIFGYVATGGGAPVVGSNGTIRGKTTPLGTKVDTSRITTDFYADFASIKPPSFDSADTSLPGLSIGTNGATEPTLYKLSDLLVKNNETLEVNGPVAILMTGDVDIKGSFIVNNGGSVTVYTEDDVTVGGTGIANLTNKPENFLIFGTNTSPGSQEIKLHGNAAIGAAVYAPNANLSLKGGGNSGAMFGAAVAYDIVITGNFEFHYDEALDDFNTERSFRIDRWRELSDYGEKADFSDPDSLSKHTMPY